MSNIDKRALREAAEGATESDWIVDAHEGWHAVIPVADAVNGNYIIAEFQGPESKRNRDFVAAANPATVLALLDELEAAEKRIADLEATAFSKAAIDVLAERQRQQSAEGWTTEHDDDHSCGEMALAASSYAQYAHRKPIAPAIPFNWPWEPEWLICLAMSFE